MTTATLTSKGQITIPSSVRAAMGVGSGDRIEFVDLGEGRFELLAATVSVTALKGMIAKPAKPVSVDDMNAAVRARGGRAR